MQPVTPAAIAGVDKGFIQHELGSTKLQTQIFDAGVRSEIEERLAMTTDLRRAVDTQRLTVAYQPVIALGTGRAKKTRAKPCSVARPVSWKPRRR